MRPQTKSDFEQRSSRRGKLRVVERRLDELKPYPGNARVHSAKQVAQIAASMRRFDTLNPILVDEDDVILAGHGRYLAARKLGLATVPAISVRHLSPAEKAAYRVADNKIASLSTWSIDALRVEFDLITSLDAGLDLEVTGFDVGAIEIMLDQPDEAPDEPEEVHEPSSGPAVCALNDLWELGRHRLVIGDATLREPYLALLGRSRARMIFTDPPYNVPIAGHVSGKGRVRHREFVAASGEMDSAQFTRFLTSSLGHMAKFSIDGALAYVCMDWGHLPELHEAAKPRSTGRSTSASGSRPTRGWAARTAASTNWSRCSNAAPASMSITSRSANTGGIGQMSGVIQG